MSEHIFQVGDIVRVRDYDDIIANYGGRRGRPIFVDGIPFTYEMEPFCGHEFTIESVIRGSVGGYEFKLGGNFGNLISYYIFTAGMLEYVHEEETRG